MAESSSGGTLTWSVDTLNNSLLLQHAFSPTTYEFRADSIAITPLPVNLVLPSNVLSAGLSYTFRLTFSFSQPDPVDGSKNAVHATVVVQANAAPSPGMFTVTPLVGVALLDDFLFHADAWSSSQLWTLVLNNRCYVALVSPFCCH